MKTWIKPVSIISMMTLTACADSDSDTDENDIIVSTGLLTLELPGAETRATLDPSVLSIIESVEDANEGAGFPTQPTGATEYEGDFSVQITGTDTFVIGSAEFEVDGAGALEYEFEVEDVINPDVAGTVVEGTFGGTSTSAGGFYSGDLAGTGTIDDGTGVIDIALDGSLNGAFDSNGNTLGSIEGGYQQVGGDLAAEFSGVYLAIEDDSP